MDKKKKFVQEEVRFRTMQVKFVSQWSNNVVNEGGRNFRDKINDEISTLMVNGMDDDVVVKDIKYSSLQDDGETGNTLLSALIIYECKDSVYIDTDIEVEEKKES